MQPPCNDGNRASIDFLKQKLSQIVDKQRQNAAKPVWQAETEWGINPDYYSEEDAHREADQALLDFINDPEVSQLFEAIEKHYA
jgi:hypothetical protein